jgi:hypothetical protein
VSVWSAREGTRSAELKTVSPATRVPIRSSHAGHTISSILGGRTFEINRRSPAPNSRKLWRACDRLNPPFGPPHTSSAVSSSWPSSSQKHTAQISSLPRESSVLYPQQGQRSRMYLHRCRRSNAGIPWCGHVTPSRFAARYRVMASAGYTYSFVTTLGGPPLSNVQRSYRSQRP